MINIIQAGQHEIHGANPGDIIVLSGKIAYGGNTSLQFRNLKGTPDKPVVILNSDGFADIKVAPGIAYCMKFQSCNHVRIVGDGEYGIRMSGAKTFGISIEQLSSDIEIDNVEIYNIGFTAVMAKDDQAQRGSFTMQNIKIHHCFVHDTGGEGLYIGSAALLGHDMKNVSIHDNRILNTRWDGLQLGQGVEGCEIYNNYIENFGIAGKAEQNNGIQIGNRTGGRCYSNTIKKGTGNGIICLGDATNVVSDNKIL